VEYFADVQHQLQPWIGDGYVRKEPCTSQLAAVLGHCPEGELVEQGEQGDVGGQAEPSGHLLGALWRFQVAEQYRLQVPQEKAAVRTLLWQLMGQHKPAGAHWYLRAAQQQQQQQQRASPVEVQDSSSAVLWSTLTSSLASDLLLVPPSIRDLMGNEWAAGAGRLPNGEGTGSSSSSSGSSGGGGGGSGGGSGAAAKMLAVQHARAARRKFAQVRQLVGLGPLAEPTAYIFFKGIGLV
jgi:hypothetical protein